MRLRERVALRHSLLATLVAAVVVACGGGGGDGGGGAPSPAPTPPPTSNMPPATGPGDTLNYFPNGGFDAWSYSASFTDGSSAPMFGLASVEVTPGARVVLGQRVDVYTQRVFGEPLTAPGYEMYYQKGPGGVAYFGTNDPLDSLSARVVPYAELLFPVQPGPIVSFSKTGVDFGADLDGDGKNETVDLSSTISLTNFEAITVPAGSFPAAARRLNQIVANARLTSSGQVVTVNASETSWLAPGAGVVRRETVTTAAGLPLRLVATVDARGYHVSGVRKGMGNPAVFPAQGILTPTAANELPDVVDTPAAASSGTSFLVIGKDYTYDALTNKWLLRRTARVQVPYAPTDPGLQFPELPPVSSNDTRETVSLAYGGGTYLAVFEQRNPVAPNVTATTQPSIVAHRFAATGVLTDVTPIELLPAGPAPMVPGVTSRHPALAYGGGRFLVIHYGGPGTSSSTYVEGRFVAPDGTVGAPFRISPDFMYNAVPLAVVFDGANFVVAFQDAAGWKLARVTPAGAVLDGAGVGIAVPAARVQLAASGSNLLVAWASDAIYARRFAPSLAPLDAGPITVAASAGGRASAVTATFHGGEYLLAWTDRLGPTNMTQLVIRLQRLGIDGVVHGVMPSPAGPQSAVPLASLVSAVPSASGLTGGYALPTFGVGSDAAIVVYVSGSSNGVTPAERAAGMQGVWIHPFAR